MFYCKECNIIGSQTLYTHLRLKHTVVEIGLLLKRFDEIDLLLNERREIDLNNKTPSEILEIYTLIKSKVEKV